MFSKCHYYTCTQTDHLLYRGPDTTYFEHEICFGYNENTLSIIDVSDHQNAVLISKKSYTNFAYTHQVIKWGSNNQTMLIV